VFGIPQALLGMANALAVALPWRKGPPNGPAGFRVSAMRHGVTGTKLKPVCGPLPINAAEAVLSAASLKDARAADWLDAVGVAVEVGTGLDSGTCVAEATGTDVDLNVAGVPPQPAKENKTRDKQMSERIPEAQDESWRRIDYPSAI
jgi:class 3 adenylate cyclase